MSTHSLPSQAFHGRPVFDPGSLLRRLRAAITGWLSPAEGAEPRSASQRLRAYASRLQRDDPRFAADLFAAADRHERLYEQ